MVHADKTKGGLAKPEDVEKLLKEAGGDENLLQQAAENVKTQRGEIRPPLTTENSNARVESK
ncbi:MAG: hypothetical protein M1120_00640 [Patescibacteria group bacterium]|nr:hypothetical protein [Patescibacteria group bacterium]